MYRHARPRRRVISTEIPDSVVELRGRCGQMGIPPFEDAAHANGTRGAGQAIGTFGKAATFSLSKHVAGRAGGFLAVEDGRTLGELEALRDELPVPDRLHGDPATTHRPLARSAVRRLRLVRPVWRTMCRLGLLERDTIRMDPQPRRLADRAHRAHRAPSLPAYEPWCASTSTVTVHATVPSCASS
ncbi:DegT/DnrJ/EryC1/StrS family aminotransferase [Streptomyces sp. G44]|uniref:DegT/DnrJ/EryC1/StrS family aminotransferase n=1 Tax=Streptomyces sp. G44 TaxID=2807632 RepID=UPI0027DE520A|nr:DegT/DnrJ/EryC1/StrS family aminotransferase [Streptomyces sp. G44]